MGHYELSFLERLSSSQKCIIAMGNGTLRTVLSREAVLFSEVHYCYGKWDITNCPFQRGCLLLGGFTIIIYRWYHKMLGPLGYKAPPPPTRTRRRTSCGKCQLMYCVACKQVWHEGDCRMVDADLVHEEQVRDIIR